jgi:hypothetical protein
VSPIDPISLENKDGSGSASRPVSEVRALALSAVVSVLMFALLAFVVQPPSFYTSDFYSFWAGARLAGPQLYDASEAEAIQHAVSPLVGSKRYIRPPFYALMLWPLGKLPFSLAYVLWFIGNLAAMLAFVRLWRFRPAAYITCAFFLPLGWSFGIGQDAPLMLLAIAAGARLVERKREMAGGAVLALCAVKPHLFLFVPVALLAQKQYRALAGLLASGGALYLLSSAVLGLNWPGAFLRAALGNEATIRPRLLGLAGLLSRFGAPAWILAVGAIAGAVIVYRYTQAAAWLPSIAFTVAAGVAFAPRAMAYDASLFLPFLLLEFSPAAVVALGAALLTVVTPAAIVSEVTALTLLWMPKLPMRGFLARS